MTIVILGSWHFSQMAGSGGIKSLTTGRNQKEPTSLVRATTPRVDLDMEKEKLEKEKGTEKWLGEGDLLPNPCSWTCVGWRWEGSALRYLYQGVSSSQRHHSSGCERLKPLHCVEAPGGCGDTRQITSLSGPRLRCHQSPDSFLWEQLGQPWRPKPHSHRRNWQTNPAESQSQREGRHKRFGSTGAAFPGHPQSDWSGSRECAGDLEELTKALQKGTACAVGRSPIFPSARRGLGNPTLTVVNKSLGAFKN